MHQTMSSKQDVLSVSYSSGGLQNEGFDGGDVHHGRDHLVSEKGDAAVHIPDMEHHPRANSSAKSGKAITFAWSAVTVHTKPKGGGICGCFGKGKNEAPKKILDNVSGVVRPGELLALMGASGAGKTTLLNVLTFRNLRDVDVDGKMFANGRQVGADDLTAISAYVQQQDLFIGTLTVREVLTFQAWLKMDKHVDKMQRRLRVEDVINELGLSKCADVLVGTPGRRKGISGGEMKRLAFACEVLTGPSLLFCDEPTSGLDSFMAENVVTVLKSQAEKGKTIIATIHQPSSEVFTLFDRIMLLAEGRVAFVGSSSDAYDFFSRLGHPCPSNYNPADFYIHSLAVAPGREAECRQRVKRVTDAFAASEEGAAVAKLAADGGLRDPSAWAANGGGVGEDGRAAVRRAGGVYKAGFGTQLAAVLWRSVKTMIREPLVLRIRLIQTIFIAVVLGLIYLQQDLDQRGVQNINGVVFLVLTNMTFSNMFSVVNVFCEELPVFLREHFNGMYRTEAYFLGRVLAELPLFILFPAIFSVITYYMIGLNANAERFFVFAAVIILVANVACSFGYMISSAAADVTLALSLGPPILIPLMLFGGFFLNTTSIPVYLEWMKWLSWFNYAFELLAINQWDGLGPIKCDQMMVPQSSPAPASLAQLVAEGSSTPATEIPGVCQGFASGDAVVSYFRFQPENNTRNALSLVALLVGYRILAYVALKLRTRNQR